MGVGGVVGKGRRREGCGVGTVMRDMIMVCYIPPWLLFLALVLSSPLLFTPLGSSVVFWITGRNGESSL